MNCSNLTSLTTFITAHCFVLIGLHSDLCFRMCLMRPLQSVLRYLAEMLLEKSTACNKICSLDRLLHYVVFVLLSVALFVVRTSCEIHRQYVQSCAELFTIHCFSNQNCPFQCRCKVQLDTLCINNHRQNTLDLPKFTPCVFAFHRVLIFSVRVEMKQKELYLCCLS